MWSRLCNQGLSGEEDDLIPVKEVLKVIQTSLALFGNSSNCLSQLRRRTINEALPADKANLAKIINSSKTLWLRALWRSGHQGSIRKGQYLGGLFETASKSEVKLRQQRFFEGTCLPSTGAQAQQEHLTFHLETVYIRVGSRSQP